LKSNLEHHDKISSSTDPIFILGIMERSGTNFVYDLLKLHPDCEYSGPIWEDFLTTYSNFLVSYAHSVFREWSPAWKVNENLGSEELICHCLGNGLITFLKLQLRGNNIGKIPPCQRDITSLMSPSSKRFLTKTPSVENLQFFFKVFPRCSLLIVVRDGRSVVESYVRSKDKSVWKPLKFIVTLFLYEAAMRKWSRGANIIKQFDESNRNNDFNYLIVQYESLFCDINNQLKNVFHAFRLDVSKYNWEESLDIPVRGSSTLRNPINGALSWNPMKKPKDFNPIERSSHWNRALHERYEWIAGSFAKHFGYQKKMFKRDYRIFWFFLNVFCSIFWWSFGAWIWRFRRIIHNKGHHQHFN